VRDEPHFSVRRKEEWYCSSVLTHYSSKQEPGVPPLTGIETQPPPCGVKRKERGKGNITRYRFVCGKKEEEDREMSDVNSRGERSKE